MTVTISSFLTAFPNAPFASRDPVDIINMINQVSIETSNYECLPSEGQQDLALSLHVAHNLTLESLGSKTGSNGERVKSYKSKNDQIVYAINENDPNGFSQTTYGQRLQQMLDLIYVAVPAPDYVTLFFPPYGGFY